MSKMYEIKKELLGIKLRMMSIGIPTHNETQSAPERRNMPLNGKIVCSKARAMLVIIHELVTSCGGRIRDVKDVDAQFKTAKQKRAISRTQKVTTHGGPSSDLFPH